MRWEQYLELTQAIKIPISEVDVDSIVDKYFKKQFPFEAKKSAEFKDVICVDSIIEYSKTVADEKIYIVAADKGVRKAFKGMTQFVIYSDINSFLKFAILQTDHIAVEVDEYFVSGKFNESVVSVLDKKLEMAHIEWKMYTEI